MKKYIAPELRIRKFDAIDIVTLSVALPALSYTEEQDGTIKYTKDLPAQD